MTRKRTGYDTIRYDRRV